MSFDAQPLTFAATIAFSLCVGYFIGIGISLSFTRSSQRNEAPLDEDGKKNGIVGENEAEEFDPVNALKAESQEDCKLVLVVRNDLGMSTGKIAAQCSHATLACYNAVWRSNPALLSHWEKAGQTKIALRCENEDALLLLQAQAHSLNLCAQTIQDAGRTQIASGSRTVVGIGPGPVRLIDQVTEKLKPL